MKKELPIRSGRPVIKPTRKFTGFAINVEYIDRMTLLMMKWGETSLNDTYNRMIAETFKREKV